MTNQTPTEQQPISQDINDYVSLYDLVLYARACRLVGREHVHDYLMPEYGEVPLCMFDDNPPPMFIEVNEYENKGKSLYKDINFINAILELFDFTKLYEDKHHSIGIFTCVKGITTRFLKRDDLIEFFRKILSNCAYYNNDLIVMLTPYMDLYEFKKINKNPLERPSLQGALFKELPDYYINRKQAIEVFQYPDYEYRFMNQTYIGNNKLPDYLREVVNTKEQQINDLKSQVEQLKAKDDENKRLKKENDELKTSSKAKDEKIKRLEKESKKLSKPQELKHFSDESYCRIILALLERLAPKNKKIIPIEILGSDENIKVNISDLANKLDNTFKLIINDKENKERTRTYRDILTKNIVGGIEFIDS